MRAGDSIARTANTTIADRKAELLAMLASDTPQWRGVGRSLPKGAAARLSVLANEIDETVLPRVLYLHAGPQEVGRITVSHRHVIGVDQPGRPMTPPDPEGLAQRFAARLGEIAATRGDLALTVGRRAAAPNHAEPSCSLAALQTALAATTIQTGFDRLQDLVTAQAAAHLVWSEASPQPQFSGAPDWTRTLHTLAEAYLSQGCRQSADARVGPLRTEGLAIPVSAQQILVMARLERSGVIAVLPFAAGLEAIAVWQRC